MLFISGVVCSVTKCVHVEGNLWKYWCSDLRVFVYHSYFTESYRRECLATAVKLLEKICRGVKPALVTQNYPDIPVACMNLVASVTNFVQCNKQQVFNVHTSYKSWF